MTAPAFKFPGSPEKDLSIVIVSFNTREILLNCLDSVYSHTENITFEILVVDNHSTDGSAKAVSEKFPQVILIQNTENRGFSAANNQAIPKSRGRFIVFLNSDTLLIENTFLKIIQYLDRHPEFSIASPKIIDETGNLAPMRLREDSPRDACLKIMGKNSSHEELQQMGAMEPREVEVVGGSCFIVRRTLFEAIGLMDEKFFLYNEEDDFCRRARGHGQKICFFPTASVKHLRGKSTHQPAIREKVIIETFKSDLYFFSKYYSLGWNLVLRSLYRLTFLLGITRTIWKRIRNTPCRGADDSILLKLRLLFMKAPTFRAPDPAEVDPR